MADGESNLDRWLDQLPALVARRHLGPGADGRLELSVELHQRLPDALARALSVEADRLESVQASGAVHPRAVTVDDGGLRVGLVLDPFDPRAVRLDVLLTALLASGSALGSSLAAFVVGAAATRLKPLHAAHRAEADLGPRRVLIGPGGGIALVAPGVPLIGMLMTPAEPRAIRRGRRAPEVLLGARPTPASDVYLLGALYYELVSGAPYRAGASPSALESAARAGLPPELPGALPDPRPSLVELLGDCLDPRPERRPLDASAFVDRLRRELAVARVPLGDRGTLARLIEQNLAAEAPRGPTSLCAETQRPTRPAAPTLGPTMPRPTPAPPLEHGASAGGAPPVRASGSGWAEILGEVPGEAEPDPAPAASGAASKEAEALRPVPSEPSPPPAAPPTAVDSDSRLRLPPAENEAPPQPAPLSGLDTPSHSAAPPTLDSAASLTPRALLPVAAGILGIAALVVTVGVVKSWLAPDRATETADAPPAPKPAFPPPAPPAAPAPAPATPAEPPPRRETPSRKLGMVSVMSNPLRARVRIDGGYVGDTPLVLRHELERKLYEVEVVLDGYRPWSRRVAPEDGKLTVFAKLAPE